MLRAVLMSATMRARPCSFSSSTASSSLMRSASLTPCTSSAASALKRSTPRSSASRTATRSRSPLAAPSAAATVSELRQRRRAVRLRPASSASSMRLSARQSRSFCR